MNILIFVLTIYFMATGLGYGLAKAFNTYDDEKAIAYFVLGTLSGWLIFPIKMIKGFVKIIKEKKEWKNLKSLN